MKKLIFCSCFLLLSFAFLMRAAPQANAALAPTAAMALPADEPGLGGAVSWAYRCEQSGTTCKCVAKPYHGITCSLKVTHHPGGGVTRSCTDTANGQCP